MNQEEYRTCMAAGLKGKTGLSKEERKMLFCEQSRICSGKASSQEEAARSCVESMSHPKEKKLSPAQEEKVEACVMDVKEKIEAGQIPPDSNPYAICTASIEHKTRHHRASKGGGGDIRLVLLSQTGCKPCSDAKEILKEHIEAGNIEVLDIAKSNEAVDLVKNNHFNSVPKLLVLVEGKPFSELMVTDNQQTI